MATSGSITKRCNHNWLYWFALLAPVLASSPEDEETSTVVTGDQHSLDEEVNWIADIRDAKRNADPDWNNVNFKGSIMSIVNDWKDDFQGEHKGNQDQWFNISSVTTTQPPTSTKSQVNWWNFPGTTSSQESTAATTTWPVSTESSRPPETFESSPAPRSTSEAAETSSAPQTPTYTSTSSWSSSESSTTPPWTTASHTTTTPDTTSSPSSSSSSSPIWVWEPLQTSKSEQSTSSTELPTTTATNPYDPSSTVSYSVSEDSAFWQSVFNTISSTSTQPAVPTVSSESSTKWFAPSSSSVTAPETTSQGSFPDSILSVQGVDSSSSSSTETSLIHSSLAPTPTSSGETIESSSTSESATGSLEIRSSSPAAKASHVGPIPKFPHAPVPVDPSSSTSLASDSTEISSTESSSSTAFASGSVLNGANSVPPSSAGLPTSVFSSAGGPAASDKPNSWEAATIYSGATPTSAPDQETGTTSSSSSLSSTSVVPPAASSSESTPFNNVDTVTTEAAGTLRPVSTTAPSSAPMSASIVESRDPKIGPSNKVSSATENPYESLSTGAADIFTSTQQQGSWSTYTQQGASISSSELYTTALGITSSSFTGPVAAPPLATETTSTAAASAQLSSAALPGSSVQVGSSGLASSSFAPASSVVFLPPVQTASTSVSETFSTESAAETPTTSPSELLSVTASTKTPATEFSAASVASSYAASPSAWTQTAEYTGTTGTGTGAATTATATTTSFSQTRGPVIPYVSSQTEEATTSPSVTNTQFLPSSLVTAGVQSEAPPQTSSPATRTASVPETPQATTTSPSLPFAIAPQQTPRTDRSQKLEEIGFKYPLNYPFVAAHSDAAAQIFQYLPEGIAQGLGIDRSQVVMLELVPKKKTGQYEFLQTIAELYIPKNQVDKLRTLLHNPDSALYKDQSDPTVTTLMSLIDIDSSLTGSTTDPNDFSGNGNGNGGTGNGGGSDDGSSDNNSDTGGSSNAVGAPGSLDQSVQPSMKQSRPSGKVAGITIGTIVGAGVLAGLLVFASVALRIYFRRSRQEPHGRYKPEDMESYHDDWSSSRLSRHSYMTSASASAAQAAPQQTSTPAAGNQPPAISFPIVTENSLGWQ